MVRLVGRVVLRAFCPVTVLTLPKLGSYSMRVIVELCCGPDRMFGRFRTPKHMVCDVDVGRRPYNSGGVESCHCVEAVW